MKKLDVYQLEKIQGGDYCTTLQNIVLNNCLSGGAIYGGAAGHQSAGCTWDYWMNVAVGYHAWC